MDQKWREAELITDRATLANFDERHRREFQTPLPCKLCVDDTLRKVQFLKDRGVLNGDEPIVKVPDSYHVAALLILPGEEEVWGMCLDHLYEFATETGCHAVKQRGRLRLAKPEGQK
jgi:hypothetical protein